MSTTGAFTAITVLDRAVAQIRKGPRRCMEHAGTGLTDAPCRGEPSQYCESERAYLRRSRDLIDRALHDSTILSRHPERWQHYADRW